MTVGVFLSWILKLTVVPFLFSLAVSSRAGSRAFSLRATLLLIALVGISVTGIVAGYMAPLNPLVWTAQGAVAVMNVAIFGYAIVVYGFSGDGGRPQDNRLE